MIRGIGTDLIEIERIEEAIQRHGSHFLDRLFTMKEQEYAFQHKNPAPTFAGRFAAKEAISKALGVGIGNELAWCDIEILNNERGQPLVTLSQSAQRDFSKPKIQISISHSKSHAVAFAIVEGTSLKDEG